MSDDHAAEPPRPGSSSQAFPSWRPSNGDETADVGSETGDLSDSDAVRSLLSITARAAGLSELHPRRQSEARAAATAAAQRLLLWGSTETSPSLSRVPRIESPSASPTHLDGLPAVPADPTAIDADVDVPAALTALCIVLRDAVLACDALGLQGKDEIVTAAADVEKWMLDNMRDRTIRALVVARYFQNVEEFDLVFEALCLTQLDNIFKLELEKFTHSSKKFELTIAPFLRTGAVCKFVLPRGPSGVELEASHGPTARTPARSTKTTSNTTAKSLRRPRFALDDNERAEIGNFDAYVTRFRTRRYSYKHRINRKRIEGASAAGPDPSSKADKMSSSKKPAHRRSRGSSSASADSVDAGPRVAAAAVAMGSVEDMPVAYVTSAASALPTRPVTRRSLLGHAPAGSGVAVPVEDSPPEGFWPGSRRGSICSDTLASFFGEHSLAALQEFSNAIHGNLPLNATPALGAVLALDGRPDVTTPGNSPDAAGAPVTSEAGFFASPAIPPPFP